MSIEMPSFARTPGKRFVMPSIRRTSGLSTVWAMSAVSFPFDERGAPLWIISKGAPRCRISGTGELPAGRVGLEVSPCLQLLVRSPHLRLDARRHALAEGRDDDGALRGAVRMHLAVEQPGLRRRIDDRHRRVRPRAADVRLRSELANVVVNGHRLCTL